MQVSQTSGAVTCHCDLQMCLAVLSYHLMHVAHGLQVRHACSGERIFILLRVKSIYFNLCILFNDCQTIITLY